MTDWSLVRTDTFLKHLKKHKSNPELLRELDKKLRRLQENPEIIGGLLSGGLHGLKSTRLFGKYRLLFLVDVFNHQVHLIALDHRGEVYN